MKPKKDCGHRPILESAMGSRSIRDFADVLGLSHNAVYAWMRNGYVPEERRESVAAASDNPLVTPDSFPPPWRVPVARKRKRA